MKKFLLIPDSFKGTMSSSRVCEIMEQAIRFHLPQAQVVSIPVADGGEGTVDSFLAAVGGEKHELQVTGPYGEPITGFYGILPDGTAVVEMAAAAGLPLVGENKHAEKTSTFGVGQILDHVVNTGCRKIILGLGGSATNDGGVGAAAALGVQFKDQEGKSFLPVGETLCKVSSIDASQINPRMKSVALTVMCDIDNPLCGPQGAAYVFAPQKGADPEMVERLDQNLAHLAAVIRRDLNVEIEHLPGAGAAGGMGGGMVAFLNGHLQMGIETVLDTVQFDTLLQDAQLVFTGEGKLDTQSLRGKVVSGVARRAKRQQVPVIAVVGDIGDQIEPVYEQGVSAVVSINRVAVPFSQAKLRSESDLELTMDSILRLLMGNWLSS
ncbi:glycerate kinase family protein [Faecalispora anaeroviscerum]|uniref:glycerate kinase family protein n=1 Tax=Faecalispora anaeroviscerum TaxID=2991836 RepID=UPI0024B8BA8B|nr:glycerate kinase [Faecalispora anaeroviscerum]